MVITLRLLILSISLNPLLLRSPFLIVRVVKFHEQIFAVSDLKPVWGLVSSYQLLLSMLTFFHKS